MAPTNACSTARMLASSTAPRRRTRALMSISMVPAGATRGGPPGDVGTGSAAHSTAATTVTGNSTGDAVALAAGTWACRCSRRQLNSRFALTPASCVMAATDAPGPRLRSTSARFKASACRRRVSWPFVTRLSMCASVG